MSISTKTAQRIITAVASTTAGNEVITALNNAASATQSIALAVVATSTSTTTNFTTLLKGDLLIHIPATAGSAAFETVATNGTKPSAAVVGDLYVALRAAPAASTLVL